MCVCVCVCVPPYKIIHHSFLFLQSLSCFNQSIFNVWPSKTLGWLKNTSLILIYGKNQEFFSNGVVVQLRLYDPLGIILSHKLK